MREEGEHNEIFEVSAYRNPEREFITRQADAAVDEIFIYNIRDKRYFSKAAVTLLRLTFRAGLPAIIPSC
jgi:hypothetical protein